MHTEPENTYYPWGHFTERLVETEDGNTYVEVVMDTTGKKKVWTLSAWACSEMRLRSRYGTCWTEALKRQKMSGSKKTFDFVTPKEP